MSTQPPRPPPPEVEELIGRAVAERLEPLYAQMASLTRSLGSISERLPRPSPGPGPDGVLAARVAALAARIEELAPLPTTVAALERTVQDELVPRLADLAALLEHSAAPLDLRQSVTSALDQAVARIETARTADAARLLEQVSALVAGAEADAERRDQQARELLFAVDERLQALLNAGTENDELVERRLASRLEAVAAEQTHELLTRIDERTRTVSDLESIAPRVVAEVQLATAATLTSQVEPLVARLVDLLDVVGGEGAPGEAVSRGPSGEARAVEDRVLAMFVDVVERAETATDRSRARLAEGQVALAARLDTVIGDLLDALRTSSDGLETRMAARVQELRATQGHHNAALLDAVNRLGHQLVEGLVEVRSTISATGTEWIAGQGELLVEQATARDDQLAAIQAVVDRVDEVGPAVARALLVEVQRATRSANAAEEAVAALSPEALRTVLAEAAQAAAAEVKAVGRRLDLTIVALADEFGRRLEALTRGDATGGAASAAAIEDVRASQAALRAAVQDGAHQAELAASDLRSLRDRLAPHLEALAEATRRRAEADKAGFDAVLARLDQLTADRPT